MHSHLHTRRGYNSTIEAVQICLRERNRHVSTFLFLEVRHVHQLTLLRYAYFKKLDYFSTECIYSPDAYRGHARTFLKDLEAARPSAIIDIIHSGEAFEVAEDVKIKDQRKCSAQ